MIDNTESEFDMARPKKTLYIVENTYKYVGDATSIICRSSWERKVCKLLDNNSDIVKWSSEEIVIPYICATDNRMHKYYIDFFIELNSGKRLIVEVKPEHETKPPKTRRKNAMFTWKKNQSKWLAAKTWADKRGMEFQIWTEVTLSAMGLMLLKPTGKTFKAIKPIKRRTRRKRLKPVSKK